VHILHHLKVDTPPSKLAAFEGEADGNPIYGRLRRMEPSLATLVLIVVGAIASVGLSAAMSAPIGDLLGESSWSIVSAFHAIVANGSHRR